MTTRSVEEINDKINRGTVRVVRADEMTRLVERIGFKQAAAEVDVVTTGTFGAMCSSGALLNFGHSDPPMRMSRIWLNGVPAYGGVAAVDAYIGATAESTKLGDRYGGAHVIEDLVAGREVTLMATSKGSACYPRRRLRTGFTLPELNTAWLLNPRNGYQRYGAAANTGRERLQTYMGDLQPGLNNINWSGAGELSPLQNDPLGRAIGVGTRIFLGGGAGWVIGPGTQHNPRTGFSTLMVQGDLQQMSAEYLRAGRLAGYGCTLYIGLGVPIPIVDETAAAHAGVRDEDIVVPVLDYAVQRRKRPVLFETTYADLKRGWVDWNGRRVPTGCLSSLLMARRVADELSAWIRAGRFHLTVPVERLPMNTEAQRGLNIRHPDLVKWEPGGKGRERGVSLDRARCISCGHCIPLCPAGVLIGANDGGLDFHPDNCTVCGSCQDACPVGALQVNVNGGEA